MRVFDGLAVVPDPRIPLCEVRVWLIIEEVGVGQRSKRMLYGLRGTFEPLQCAICGRQASGLARLLRRSAPMFHVLGP